MHFAYAPPSHAQSPAELAAAALAQYFASWRYRREVERQLGEALEPAYGHAATIAELLERRAS